MKNLAFWSAWRQPAVARGEKIFYLFALAIFGVALLGYTYSFWVGDAAVIRWDTVGELQPYRSVIDVFEHFGFEFTLDADSYLLTEKFTATDLALNFPAAVVFFGLTVFGLLAMLTVATFLNRIWYAVLASAFLMFLALLQFELLGVFGRTDKAFLIGTLVAYLPLSFFFQAFDPNQRFSFVARFSLFLVITAVVGYLLANYSEGTKSLPFFLASYTYIVPLIVTILFVAVNAHEIINGILYLLTNAANPASGNTLTHFIVLSVVYLLNLAYAYAYAIGWVDFGIVYVSPFVVYFASTVLGIWGFGKKEVVFASLPFAPYGAILYVAMGTVSTAFVAFAFASANDPLREMLEDTVLFTHLGIGFVFLMYVLSNFRRLIAQNKAVHKVVYKPGQLEYMWVHLIGGVVVAMMLFRSNFFPYRQAFAGFYNQVGDLYRAEGDNFASEQYYKIAVNYDYLNHRSNYSLGSLARIVGDEAMALYYFREATQKKPMPHDYANLSELLLQNDKKLDAIFTLHEGLKKFPKNGELMNNLGLLYAQKTDILDSAAYYLSQARQVLDHRPVAEANFYAVAAKLNNLSPDSLRTLFQPEAAVATQANELAFYNKARAKYGRPLNPDYLRDSVLETVNLCYLYNYALNEVGSSDTAIFAPLDRFAKVKANIDFVEYLELAKAFKYRELGQNAQGLGLMRRLYALNQETNPYYGNALGTWLLEMGQYQLAERHFAQAGRLGNPEGLLNQAVALSELPAERPRAIEAWQRVASLGNPEFVATARDLLRLVHPDSVARLDVAKLSDSDRFRLAHYNHARLGDAAFNTLFNAIGDNNLKIMALVDRMQFYLGQNNLPLAENIRNSITGVDLTGSSPEVQNALKLVDLQLLYGLKRYDGLATLLKEFAPAKAKRGYASLYAGAVAEQKGQAKEAEQLYRRAVQQLPYEAEAAVALAMLYNRQKQPQKAYDLLVDALKPYDDDHRLYPPRLLEMYILQCLEVRLRVFAQDNLPRLAEIVSPAEYEKFMLVYEQRKAELDKNSEGFE
jgi:tetratricopeptide (TPR) repeat protein